MKGEKFFTSWSGGKDSCLAHYLAAKEGMIPKILFTMAREEKDMTRSHGIPISILIKQAEALGLDYDIGYSTWNNYEEVFLNKIRQYKSQGINYGVFGDMDLEEHKMWEENISKNAGLSAYLPLWQKGREENALSFVEHGFTGIIVAVKSEYLGSEYIGRKFDGKMIAELIEKGVDPAGEGGEFHTLVTNGPIFKNEVKVNIDSVQNLDNKYFFANYN